MRTVARLRSRLELATWDLRAWRARNDVAKYGHGLPTEIDRHVADALALGRGGATYTLAPIDRDAVIISAGVGAEITFELEAIERFGAAVHALDPTDESAAFIAEAETPDRFHFHPLALGGVDGPLALGTLKPASPQYRAVSALAEAPSQDVLSAEGVRLATLMDRLGVAEVEVLKLDIEGGEYAVLEDLFVDGPMPRQLILEFHPHILNLSSQGRFSAEDGWRTTAAVIERIRSAGFDIFHISERRTEYSFLRR